MRTSRNALESHDVLTRTSHGRDALRSRNAMESRNAPEFGNAIRSKTTHKRALNFDPEGAHTRGVAAKGPLPRMAQTARRDMEVCPISTAVAQLTSLQHFCRLLHRYRIVKIVVHYDVAILYSTFQLPRPDSAALRSNLKFAHTSRASKTRHAAAVCLDFFFGF
jgi:hypothetical protein